MEKIVLGSAMASAIAIGAVVTMLVMFSSQVSNTNPEIQEAIRHWQPLADADPGAGACGVVNIHIYPHSATPATTYGSNITEGNSYTYGHANETMGKNGYVPYNTAFDIIVRYQFNSTVAKCSTNNTWMLSWVNMTIRIPDLSINANTTMYKVNITTTPDYMWVSFYMNNGGAGYTITHGQNISYAKFTPYANW